MPTKHKFTILKQVMKHIPPYLVTRLSKEHGVDKQSRSFSPWSHVVSMVYAQLAHVLSLNDTCDGLKHHESALKTIRGATPPSRNGLSHANRERNGDMAEALFWGVLSSLQTDHPEFGIGKEYCGFPHRFKRIINIVDSTTIQLVANCIDWAKHRRRKAAAKCHMRLDLQTFLPRFALVKSADSHDSTEAKALCADMEAGEIVIFDKAYVDFIHLYELQKRDIFWVTRAKDNMTYRTVRKNKCCGNVKKDVFVKLTGLQTKNKYSDVLRLVVATVKVDGKDVEMTFMSNNLKWSASSICDLYKARWSVEVFFKQIKQTLQLADFLGHNENAVRWQIWTALLTYVILRFISHVGQWKKGFARLFTVIRGVLWSCLDLFSLLKSCGTAHAPPRMVAHPEQLYIPGFAA
jgi:hypothetical protein